jgi:hypothetical protein
MECQNSVLRDAGFNRGRVRENAYASHRLCVCDASKCPRWPVAHPVWLSGHTSTTPWATARGVCDTRFTASANVAASITANPATGSAQDMKEPVFVTTFFASVFRTCTGVPAAPIRMPASRNRVMGVRCVANGCVCAVVPAAVPVSDRRPANPGAHVSLMPPARYPTFCCAGRRPDEKWSLNKFCRRSTVHAGSHFFILRCRSATRWIVVQLAIHTRARLCAV